MGLACTKQELTASSSSSLFAIFSRQRKLNPAEEKGDGDNDNNNITMTKQMPKVTSVEDVGSTRWLALKTIHYTNYKGEDSKWDMASRTTKDMSDPHRPDASIIVPILKSTKSNTLETLLIRQYRPPVQQYAMEFPAGLIDPGETPEQAAMREFKEETGYTGVVDTSFSTGTGGGTSTGPRLCMTPGLTNETVTMIVLMVDLDDPINENPEQDLEGDEDIEIKRVPLLETLKSIMEETQMQTQTKTKQDGDTTATTAEKETGITTQSSLPVALLYSFALGIEMGMKYGASASSSSK